MAEDTQLAGDIVAIFRRTSTSWGPRMNDLLQHCVHSLVRIPGASFLDIYTIITDHKWRMARIHKLPAPLRDFWLNQFPKWGRSECQPIISRMTDFRLSPEIRSTFGSSVGLNIQQLIEDGRIFIVNLSGFGPNELNFIGSVLVSLFQLAIRRRVRIPPASRTLFHLYIDEFEEFVTGELRYILDRARKFKVPLTLAHQYVQQLSDLRHATQGIALSFIFRVGREDAQGFKSVILPYTPEELVNLRDFTCYFRRNGAVHQIKTPPAPQPRHSFRTEIIAESRTFIKECHEAHASRQLTQAPVESEDERDDLSPSDGSTPHRPKKKRPPSVR